MSYESSNARTRRAERSVGKRMREREDEQRAEAEAFREREASEYAERCAKDPYFAAYGWTGPDDVDPPEVRRAIASVRDLEEEREERELDADDDAGDDGGRHLPPGRRAVRSVEKMMRQRNLLSEEGAEADFADSVASDEEIANRVKAVMPKRSAVEMIGEGIADEADAELREMIEAQDAEFDEHDDEEE